jgi:rhodanese-related sulfurtransferase
VTAEEAHQLISGRDALLLDVRDASELSGGKLRGALNISRGMLEFRADPEGNYYNPELRKARPVILYCASGGRSALAGQTLQQMGYAEVYNLGGFKDAVDNSFPTEPAETTA